MGPWNAKLIESLDIEIAAVPIDTTGAAVTGDYYSLKNYGGIAFLIMQGAWAGGTPAVTLKQAVDVAGTNEKALTLTEYWSKTGLTSGSWTRTAVTSDTFNLTATANKATIIEVSARKLDTANGFDCVRLGIASPGANADLIAVPAFLLRARNVKFPPDDATTD